MSIDAHEAIRNTLAAYCFAADAADAERWVALFTDDAELDLNLGGPPLRGRDEVRKFATSLRGGSMHMSANVIVAVDDDGKGDTATATSYLLLVAGKDDPQIRLGGRYEDRLRRVDGHWLIASRRLEPTLRRQA